GVDAVCQRLALDVPLVVAIRMISRAVAHVELRRAFGIDRHAAPRPGALRERAVDRDGQQSDDGEGRQEPPGPGHRVLLHGLVPLLGEKRWVTTRVAPDAAAPASRGAA